MDVQSLCTLCSLGGEDLNSCHVWHFSDFMPHLRLSLPPSPPTHTDVWHTCTCTCICIHTHVHIFFKKTLLYMYILTHAHSPLSHTQLCFQFSLSPSLSLSLAYCDFWWFCSADVFGSCGIVLSIEALVGRYSWQPCLENTVWKTNLSKIPKQVYGEENKK